MGVHISEISFQRWKLSSFSPSSSPRHLARQPSAILPCPQSVLEVTSAAIWDHTLTVGWETSACLRDLSAPLRAILLFPPCVARLTSHVTWDHLLRAAGSEMSACRRAPSVLLLLDIDF